MRCARVSTPLQLHSSLEPSDPNPLANPLRRLARQLGYKYDEATHMYVNKHKGMQPLPSKKHIFKKHKDRELTKDELAQARAELANMKKRKGAPVTLEGILARPLKDVMRNNVQFKVRSSTFRRTAPLEIRAPPSTLHPSLSHTLDGTHRIPIGAAGQGIGREGRAERAAQ